MNKPSFQNSNNTVFQSVSEDIPDYESDEDVLIEEAPPKLGDPKKYAVILHNDNYSTMEFVIEVLVQYFHKTHEQANELMLKVHYEGRAVAGIYDLDIAETKCAQVMEVAQKRGYPLLCTVEPLTFNEGAP